MPWTPPAAFRGLKRKGRGGKELFFLHFLSIRHPIICLVSSYQNSTKQILLPHFSDEAQ